MFLDITCIAYKIVSPSLAIGHFLIDGLGLVVKGVEFVIDPDNVVPRIQLPEGLLFGDSGKELIFKAHLAVAAQKHVDAGLAEAIAAAPPVAN